MTHLAQNAPVLGDDALDGVERTVGVAGRFGRRMTVGAGVLESYLPALEQPARQLLADHELALAVG